MSENKFIKHLKGEDTAKSVLEIKNQRTTTSFANMPLGTSNANDVYSDHRGNAIGVLRGTDNWKVADINSLINATTVYGDGRDVTGSYNVSSNSLWVDAIYTFTGPKTFAPNTKFVLKLCGERLSNTEDIVPFSLVITIGNAIVTKSFAIREHAFEFSEEFVIDFTESNSALIKCVAGTTMRVQLLCGSADASATIYTGMTVFTALQRRVDGDTVVSDKKTFDEIVEDVEDLEEYVDDTFVRLDGTSIMTGPLKMRASISFQCAIAPYWDGVGFFKLNDDNSVTLIASIDTSDGFLPWVTNTYNIGSSLKKWKNLYLAGKAYVATINNGSDITVPNSTGEMLVNTATNSTSLSIFGNAASGINTINIGRYTTPAGVNSIMIGNYSKAGEGAMAFGNGAEAASYGFAYLGKAAARYAYQIGRGTNSESYTLYVGWGTNENYKMLDGTTGFIPDARISSNIARMSDVELAARSGRMITDQGVWYAKMYSETVPPAAENGTNYADFSQVDGQGNPIIVTYNRVNGAWVQDQTITPPADYDGYVPITSKIWDIAEQDGQQGGRILWNHTSKEFTPYPQIVSFDSIEITGDSTVEMPQTPTDDNIANVGFVKATIGGARNIGDIFYTMRKDSAMNGAVECNGGTYSTADFDGAASIGNLLALNKIPYVSLAAYQTLLNTQGSVGVFGWDGVGTTTFRVPSLEDIFIETGTAAQLGNYIAPGVPNITVNPTAPGEEQIYTKDWATGAMTGVRTGAHANAGGGAISCGYVTFDASRSSSVYRNDVDTVQPNAVRYRAMVQLAISATDEAVETCTAITSQVATNTSDISTLQGYDYVVESQLPTAQNNYTWYRKYKSGWVEQGGIITETSTVTQKSIVFPVEMADANYNLQVTLVTDTNSNSPTYYSVGARTKSATGFTCYAAANFTKDWKVCGVAA